MVDRFNVPLSTYISSAVVGRVPFAWTFLAWQNYLALAILAGAILYVKCTYRGWVAINLRYGHAPALKAEEACWP